MKANDAVVAGVRITHPDKLMFPELGLTKLDLARYYEAVAPRMLPHLDGRPLTLVFCPTGVGEGCRYLRHSKVWGPKTIRRIRIREKTKVGEYMVADTVEALISLAQMNVVEIHTWNSTDNRVEQPNRIVLDLDPGARITWSQVLEGAKLVRSVLDALRLRSWVKTTGGRGLHVVVPIAPERDWSECLDFARAVATLIAERQPELYTLNFKKTARADKILIDYLRNNRTNTSICALSVRAREGAPVSMPLAWTDLKPPLDPGCFDVKTVSARASRGWTDPWREYWRTKQRLTGAVLKALASL